MAKHYEVGTTLWVLRLRDSAREDAEVEGEGDWFYADDADDELFMLTDDIQKATWYEDKDAEIEFMKAHEAFIKKDDKYAICNYGYTNMMQNFEFVECEVAK